MERNYYGDMQQQRERLISQAKELIEVGFMNEGDLRAALKSQLNRYARFYGFDNKYADMKLP